MQDRQKDEEVFRQERLCMLGKAMTELIVLNKHQIELRRQYLKDIRFIDKQNTQLGKKASMIEFNDLLHFESEFISYIKDYQYPFKNDIFKLRNGANISEKMVNKANDFSFIPCSDSESFGHFLKFIHNEFGINLICEESDTADDSQNLNQGVSQMNETLRS